MSPATRIAVICAYNPGGNTGMYTVDEATRIAFAGHDPGNIDFYYLGAAPKGGYSDEECTIRYRQLQDHYSELGHYDTIIFWGDFLHSYTYWRNDLIPRLVRHKVCVSEEEAWELAYKCLMLSDLQDGHLKKVGIFGSTTLPDGTAARTDNRFKKSFERLVGNAGLVMFRDPVSAWTHAHLRPNDSLVGTDCATLVSLTSRPARAKKGPIGVFVGRSPKFDLFKFALLVRFFSFKYKTPYRWIQWNTPTRLQRRIKLILGYPPRGRRQSPMELIQELESCSFVISDTYHVCVNAWARGIPAICFGHGARFDSGTLGSKKKELFFSQILAESHYFFWEDLSLSRLGKTAAEIEDIRHKHTAADAIYNQLADHAAYGVERLRDFLTPLPEQDRDKARGVATPCGNGKRHGL